MTELDDDTVKEIFITNYGFISSKLKRKYSNDKESKIHKYIINRFADSLSFEESLYRICWDIGAHPKCKICGNPVQITYRKDRFYTNYCCKECVQHDKEIIKKKEKTYFNKTGYTHNSRNPESIQRISETSIKKYGTKFPCQSEVVKEKIKKTCIKKIWSRMHSKIKYKIRKNKTNLFKKIWSKFIYENFRI